MKKIIMILALMVASPVFAAVYDVTGQPAISINGMALDKSMIMKASYNASTHQIVILYGIPSKNQLLSVPGKPQDITAINNAVASWEKYLDSQDNRREEDLKEMQKTFGDTYVEIQKEIYALYKQPNPQTATPYIDIHKSFNRVIKNAKIENFRFHDLRHTVATRLVESGIDLLVVQEILVHTKIETTMRYAHPVPKRKLDAIEILNSYAKK